MIIRCWGSRGSIPVSGSEYIKYGGDTTCLEIRTQSDDIIIVDAGTGPQVAASIGSCNLVGEIAMLCDVPRTAGIIAKTDLKVITITRETFFNLMQEFPEISLKIIRLIAQRLDKTNRELAVLRGEFHELKEQVDLK